MLFIGVKDYQMKHLELTDVIDEPQRDNIETAHVFYNQNIDKLWLDKGLRGWVLTGDNWHNELNWKNDEIFDSGLSENSENNS